MSESMLQKWSEHFEEWRTICDFFEWLNHKGIFLAKFIEIDGERWHYARPISKKILDLFCESYEIDQNQLERERRELLENVRREQGIG